MAVYQYKAYTSTGQEKEGFLEAENIREALGQLKKQGLFVKKIEEKRLERKILKRSVNKEELAELTSQLATLISAGIPVAGAFNSLKKEYRGNWYLVLEEIETSLKQGYSLAKSLESYPHIFPDFYINMIEAGENSGALDVILDKLAQYLEQEQDLKDRIQMALIYPVITIGVSLTVLILLFSFVIPRLVGMFESSKAALPLVTQILLKVTAYFQSYYHILFLILGLLVVGILYLKVKYPVRWGWLFYYFPGGLFKSLYCARFSRIFSLLSEAGLPVLKALYLSGKATGNRFLVEKIKIALKLLEEGNSLSSTLAFFPSVLTKLIETGEQTGKLPQVLQKAALSYEKDFDKKVKKFLNLLEPLVILFLGGIVSFIVVAVLLPILQLSQIVKL